DDADVIADAAPDAEPDAAVPDTTPPQLVEITPAQGSPTWLGGPVRLIYDEPIIAQGALTATATLAGTAVTATAAIEAPSTIRVALDPNARGVGALSVHVAGSIHDAAGNVTTVAEDVSLIAPPWSNVPI